ncbi:hypothetical protein [Thermaurantiacus sp.]
MDLAFHEQFRNATELFQESCPIPPPEAPSPPAADAGPGRALLLAAWSALQSSTIEAVDLSLASGREIRNAIRLRLAGPIAQASTRRDGWTHIFPVEQLALVRFVARGGHRD